MRQIVGLWQRARAQGQAVYLATVVHVQGSAYRKPGARLLVTATGEYAGSVSGGCLEGEIVRKIAWMTRLGPRVEQYRSSVDEDTGLGCGGTVWILMEAGAGATQVLEAAKAAVESRRASVVVMRTGENDCGSEVVWRDEVGAWTRHSADDRDRFDVTAARCALRERRIVGVSARGAELPEAVYCPILPLPQLLVFGAGDDAKPLVRFAAELGWEVSVADGRSHLVRQERFPDATHLRVLQYALPGIRDTAGTDTFPVLLSSFALEPDAFAVLLTHSQQQDRALLQALLPQLPRYLGVLGPLHRTTRLLEDLAPSLGLSVAECFRRLHAPVGLDFGGGDASVIALSIVSEMQTILANTEGTAERHREMDAYASSAA